MALACDNCAGLWKEDLHNGLLWRPHLSRQRRDRFLRSPTYF